MYIEETTVLYQEQTYREEMCTTVLAGDGSVDESANAVVSSVNIAIATMAFVGFGSSNVVSEPAKNGTGSSLPETSTQQQLPLMTSKVLKYIEVSQSALIFEPSTRNTIFPIEPKSTKSKKNKKKNNIKYKKIRILYKKEKCRDKTNLKPKDLLYNLLFDRI